MPIGRDQNELVALVVDIAHLPRRLRPEEIEVGCFQDVHGDSGSWEPLLARHCAAFSPSVLAIAASWSRCSWTLAANAAGPRMSMIVPMSAMRAAMTGSAETARKSAAMVSRNFSGMPRGPNTPPTLSNV